MNQNLQEIYEVLCIGKSPLETAFAPVKLESIKNSYQKNNSRKHELGHLYKDANVIQAIKALGYTDV